MRMAKDERHAQRSLKAKQDFERKTEFLKNQIAKVEKLVFAYDDLFSDTTELFSSGEKIEWNEESVGTSSKSLTTLFWNIGNWRRGENWSAPSCIDFKKLYYKEEHPDTYPDHVPENNKLFLQMVKNLRAHMILIC